MRTKTIRGKGVGGRLIEPGLAWLEERFDHIYLSVYSENFAAQRLYARYGFEKVHEYLYKVGNQSDPRIYYEAPMTQTLLLCIGAQKAGTTWLADFLRDHPEVHLPPVKEVHFFDARFAPKWCAKYEEDMLAEFQHDVAALSLKNCGDPAIQHKLHSMLLRFRMIANPQEYIRFMSWGAQGRSVLFEATPDYSMVNASGFQAMNNMHPDTRLVFLLRNPADRFWSSMKFNRKHNPSFDIDARFDNLLTREDFMLLADYDRTIREALKHFPPGKVARGIL